MSWSGERPAPFAPLRALRSPFPRGRRGFSLIELSVVALLVAGLLLISGQLFVELIRRQAGFGLEFASTAGFTPFDSILLRDVREATDSLPFFKDHVKSDRVLILALPSDDRDTDHRRTVVYEMGEKDGLTRTQYAGDTVESTRSFSTSGVLRYQELDDLGRRQLRLEAVPFLSTDPTKKPPPTLCRLATYRNVW